MCGIIGFTSLKVVDSDLDILRKVMIESRIRGKHASGIAWWDGSSIKSKILPIPIDKLINKFDLHGTVYGGQVSLVAHARYSTSDIKYNQPLIGDNIAIAHNGVITQSEPSNWEKLYGYCCETHNDSELLLKALENNDNPYEVFPNSSISAVVLKDGQVDFIRNGVRPLWCGRIGKGIVYASTYDILNRAGVSNIIKLLPSQGEEFQRRDWKSWKK